MRISVVESSTLATVGYDDTLELLQLKFCSGAVYEYFGVPIAVHQALLDASSKGGYFNRSIRNCYRYRLLTDQRPASSSTVPRARG